MSSRQKQSRSFPAVKNKDRRFKDHPLDPQQVQGHLDGAYRKLAAAQKIADDDEESAYQLAYEAMLKASLALIFRDGKRPRSLPGHHIAIIEMAGTILGAESEDLIKVFQQMRTNRNSSLYEACSFISSHEREEALEVAKKYLDEIKKKLAGN